ncbi:hypothetical protein SODALDRAFT_359005 [Sodiomyces alkalinus F11]|uniref:Uncharacterized protein n=1 Tax=Sodiomyces alkalinus (strain CBS 110278 / VKM F-3762 / F11) TaxID=1314773 RepID=A0A3N2PXD6_SODAK|nr:hypothetical protein SODALDRAFT_359005 [Sodiomyces alkalinus F11]ROT39138.1 hypothetical protein SODALDRAFT_359005 [Sodiomyces alkalinus F11]
MPSLPSLTTPLHLVMRPLHDFQVPVQAPPPLDEDATISIQGKTRAAMVATKMGVFKYVSKTPKRRACPDFSWCIRPFGMLGFAPVMIKLPGFSSSHGCCWEMCSKVCASRPFVSKQFGSTCNHQVDKLAEFVLDDALGADRAPCGLLWEDWPAASSRRLIGRRRLRNRNGPGHCGDTVLMTWHGEIWPKTEWICIWEV